MGGTIMCDIMILLETFLLLTLCSTIYSWPLMVPSPTALLFRHRAGSPITITKKLHSYSSALRSSSSASSSEEGPSCSTINGTTASTVVPLPSKNAGRDDEALVDRLIKLSTTGNKKTKSSECVRHKYSSFTVSTLGDIMASSSSNLLLTSPSAETGGDDGKEKEQQQQHSLASRFGITHPLDRMALTANGNLQRLLSSYYDAPVSVVVDRCVQRRQQQPPPPPTTTTLIKHQQRFDGVPPPGGANHQNSAIVDELQTTDEEEKYNNNNDNRCSSSSSSLRQQQQQLPIFRRTGSTPDALVWDRVVRLRVYNQTFCTARSVITVYDPLCQELVESGAVGLGQLFRFLDILPEFTLLKAGKINNCEKAFTTDAAGGGGGGFWRDYKLDCAELSCRIHEEFCPGMWQLQPLLQRDRDDEAVDGS